jgi:hypothetical protein
MAAAFGKALAAGAAKQENNNVNIGNTTNVWPVANLPANQIKREQRAIEEYTRIERELARVSNRLRQCETTLRSAPQSQAEAGAIINDLTAKPQRTNREEAELRRAYADFIRVENDVKGCQAEMAGLLAKKRQLNTEEFFQRGWVKNTKNMSAFNKPARGAGGGAVPRYSSMVGGRRRQRKTRRK